MKKALTVCLNKGFGYIGGKSAVMSTGEPDKPIQRKGAVKTGT